MSYDPNQPYGQSEPYQQPPTQYTPPQFGQGYPNVPPFAQPQQQPKRSLRWLWITLGIVGGVLVLSCVACGAIAYFGGKALVQTIAAPISTANSYYTAIQKQDYGSAYSYLNISTLTSSDGTTQQASADVFSATAQAIDVTKGAVTSFSITSTNVTNNTATIVVHVTRSSGSYDVTLTLQQENGTWKITNFDNI